MRELFDGTPKTYNRVMQHVQRWHNTAAAMRASQEQPSRLWEAHAHVEPPCIPDLLIWRHIYHAVYRTIQAHRGAVP
jgi:hypothetical protein